MNTKRKILTIIINLCFLEHVFCAKILYFTYIPAKSHQKVHQEVWKELSLRGHQVHAVTPNPVFNTSLTNLTEYDISSTYKFADTYMTEEHKKQFFHKPTFVGTIVRQLITFYIGGLGIDFLFSHQEVERLVDSHKTFDVCIFEWYYPSVAVYGDIFNCPTIGFGSNGLPVQMLDTIGNPSHPITAPEQDLPILRDKITFFQSVWSLFWVVFVRLLNHWVLLPTEDKRIKRFYGGNVPYLGDLQNNVSLIILNRNIAFHRPVPNLPNVIELGAIRYSRPVRSIDLSLKKFLDGSKRGIIYFSLGISMSGTSMPPTHVKKIQNVFSNLPFDFLWKWENKTMENRPNNVFISKFIPQVEVLEHPNVKLFITQGGLQSTEEAIAAHKPIIGIPFHSDQTTNVDTCVQYGMGKMLDLEDLTEETLRSYILDIVNNPSYAENAKKLDELMKDQPQDGLEKAIWWIEYVIRHKGAKHLRSIAVDMPWWQYLMLDVIGFILVVLLSISFIVYFSFKLLLSLLCKVCRKGKSTKRKAE